MRDLIYSVLDRPWLYNLATSVLAPGAEAAVKQKMSALLARLPSGEPLLDIGCGPYSWLNGLGVKPVGLDLNPQYMAAHDSAETPGVVASADSIPFKAASFAGVWSIGLFHHLPDEVALGALNEAKRVCRDGGYIAILDAVLPESVLRRPIAAAIRRMDRGEFMRKEARWRALLGSTGTWECERFTYSRTGLEMLVSVLRK